MLKIWWYRLVRAIGKWVVGVRMRERTTRRKLARTDVGPMMGKVLWHTEKKQALRISATYEYWHNVAGWRGCAGGEELATNDGRG
jgi:hypothetical protein